MTVIRFEVRRHAAPAAGRHLRVEPPQPSPPAPPAAPTAARLSRAARHAAAEDAKLLAALRLLASNPSFYPRALYLALGFTAITALAVALTGALPLPYGLRFAVLPATAILVLVSVRHPAWGRRALLGLVAGMVATGIYDLLRLGLAGAGLWGDPIPSIGRMALADPDAHPFWGYLWRFVGNGGGMGLAFAMLPWRGVRLGIAYGSSICLGLLGLLAAWPEAQLHFFPLTPVTAAGAMAGHWVYGAVLGGLTARWLPPVGKRARRRRSSPRTKATLVAVPDAPDRPDQAAKPDPPIPGGLTPDELQAVRCTLQQRPRAHGFPTDQWTLRRVAVVVERATGVGDWQPSELWALLDTLDLDLPLRHPSTPRALVS